MFTELRVAWKAYKLAKDFAKWSEANRAGKHSRSATWSVANRPRKHSSSIPSTAPASPRAQVTPKSTKEKQKEDEGCEPIKKEALSPPPFISAKQLRWAARVGWFFLMMTCGGQYRTLVLVVVAFRLSNLVLWLALPQEKLKEDDHKPILKEFDNVAYCLQPILVVIMVAGALRSKIILAFVLASANLAVSVASMMGLSIRNSILFEQFMLAAVCKGFGVCCGFWFAYVSPSHALAFFCAMHGYGMFLLDEIPCKGGQRDLGFLLPCVGFIFFLFQISSYTRHYSVWMAETVFYPIYLVDSGLLWFLNLII